MADLTNTLVSALRDGNRAAQDHLDSWAQSNYAEFARALAVEIAADDKPVEARQMASIYLKNTLNGKSASTQKPLHDRWKALDPVVRNQIKEPLLLAMRSTVSGVAAFVAVPVAEVACVELPHNAWPEFIDVLKENITAEGSPETTKLAGLKCLGNTCQRLAEVQDLLGDDAPPDLAPGVVDQMLTCIVGSLEASKPYDLRLTALNALNESLLFVRKNMEVQHERDFIIRGAICASASATEEDIRRLAYECLDKVGDLYYEKLQDYMTDIFRLTTATIKSDPEEQVVVNAIEFWSTIAYAEQSLLEEEKLYEQNQQTLDRPPCNRYIESAMHQLVPLLLERLTQQDEHSDPEDYDPRAASANCLEAISQTVGEKVLPLVIPFVQNNIVNEDWRLRDAGIVAFTKVMDGPDSRMMESYIRDAIPVLLQSLNHFHILVRISSADCISTICELHSSVVPGDQVLPIIQSLASKLGEESRVASQAATAIANICKSIKQFGPSETNVLSACSMPLLEALFNAGDRADSDALLIEASYAAAAELIDASASDVHPVLVEVFPRVLDRIEKALKLDSTRDEQRDRQLQLLASLTPMLMSLLQKLDRSTVSPHADRMINTIMDALRSPHGANYVEEMLLILGAAANCLEDGFMKYLDHVIGFVLESLHRFDIPSLCRVAVGVVVDLCDCIGNGIQPYCDKIMSQCMECLRDGTADRDLKPAVLSCIGDVAMAIGASFEPYLTVTTMFLMQAAQQQPPPGNPDLLAFINSLRVSVLEAYSGILIGLSEGGAIHLFEPLFQNALNFLQYLSLPASERDEEVLQKAVALIGDITRELGKDANVRDQLKQPYIEQLIQECGNAESGEARETAQWAYDLLRQT